MKKLLVFLNLYAYSAEILPVNTGDDITAEKFNKIIDSVNCPAGLVRVTNFCIEPETTVSRGTLGSVPNVRIFCRNKGLRMCSQNEIQSSIDYNKIKMYDIYTEGDSWYVSGDRMNFLSDNTTDYAITVQGNNNQPSHPIGSIELHPISGASYFTYICCY